MCTFFAIFHSDGWLSPNENSTNYGNVLPQIRLSEDMFWIIHWWMFQALLTLFLKFQILDLNTWFKGTNS